MSNSICPNSKQPLPYCRHKGNRDCYALDPFTCKCTLLSETYWIDGKGGNCPFYKTDKEIRKHEKARNTN